tara:strand:+ start:282037 stop:282777 length:741 start_codon:yes stop_codon:yes gene_type:complete
VINRFSASLAAVFLSFALVLAFTQAAFAEVVPWKGPTHTVTIGLNEEDISQIEFPEEITNITLENPDYVDVYVVADRGNRAFRMRSLLPKMATRMFMTGASGNTYIVVLTTDVPYSSFVEVVDASKIDDVKQLLSKKFGPQDLVRAMAMDKELPGVLRETHLIPDWFRGNGLTFELSEVWQTPLMTGLVVHVANERQQTNEVNLPAITIPRTDEWGILRHAAMENMRLAPRGLPNDRGVMFLVFKR